jgi:hypothetical protein
MEGASGVLSGGFAPHTLGAGISPIIDGPAVTETQLVGTTSAPGGFLSSSHLATTGFARR